MVENFKQITKEQFDEFVSNHPELLSYHVVSDTFPMYAFYYVLTKGKLPAETEVAREIFLSKPDGDRLIQDHKYFLKS